MYFVDLYTLAYIYGFDIREAFIFGESLVYFFVKLDPFSEIIFSLFRGLLFVVNAIQFDYLDIIIDDGFLITNRLYPD